MQTSSITTSTDNEKEISEGQQEKKDVLVTAAVLAPTHEQTEISSEEITKLNGLLNEEKENVSCLEKEISQLSQEKEKFEKSTAESKQV